MLMYMPKITQRMPSKNISKINAICTTGSFMNKASNIKIGEVDKRVRIKKSTYFASSTFLKSIGAVFITHAYINSSEKLQIVMGDNKNITNTKENNPKGTFNTGDKENIKGEIKD